MSDQKGKVEIKVGNLSFSAEGDQEWLAEQLRKVIAAAAPAIAKEESIAARGKSVDPERSSSSVGTLASYIKAKNGTSNQVQRFLATAGWLHRRGATDLTTAEIVAALLAHRQKALINPPDALNKNCTKGYCEKTKDGFFITPDGWSALDEEQ